MTTLYSPLGDKVEVTNPTRVAQLISRGYSETPITPPEPEPPPWEDGGGGGLTVPILEPNGDGDTYQFAKLDVSEDVQNEDTSNWLNRIELGYRRMVGAVLQPRRLVTFFNEFWEIRGVPAKPTTTYLRVYGKEFTADPDHDPTVPVIEVSTNRDTRITVWGVMANGDMVRKVGSEWVILSPVVVADADPGLPGIPWLNTGA